MTDTKVSDAGGSPASSGPIDRVTTIEWRAGQEYRSVRELAEEWIVGRAARGELTERSPGIERSRLASFLARYGDLPSDSLDRRALLDWQASIGHMKATTRRAYIGSVRRFCQWLLLEGHLGVDLTPALVRVREPRRAPRALPGVDVGRALSAAREAPPGPRGRRQPAWSAIALLMVQCGLRCVEVSRADVSDWDPVARRVLGRGKFGHQRWVPVPSEAAVALEAYLADSGHTSGPLFRAIGSKMAGNRRLSPAWISRKMGRIMHDAGVHEWGDGRSAHALRHTFATDVSRRTDDLLVLRDLLGHVSLATTQIYLGTVSEDRLRAAVEGRRYLDTPALPEHPFPTAGVPSPAALRTVPPANRLHTNVHCPACCGTPGCSAGPHDENACAGWQPVGVGQMRVWREGGSWWYQSPCPSCGDLVEGRLHATKAKDYLRRGALRQVIPPESVDDEILD